jgi:hypothetical protein
LHCGGSGIDVISCSGTCTVTAWICTRSPRGLRLLLWLVLVLIALGLWWLCWRYQLRYCQCQLQWHLHCHVMHLRSFASRLAVASVACARAGRTCTVVFAVLTVSVEVASALSRHGSAFVRVAACGCFCGLCSCWSHLHCGGCVDVISCSGICTVTSWIRIRSPRGLR